MAAIKELDIKPDELVYIGAEDGSGFYWIGKRSDIPDEYLDLESAGEYSRTVEYAGTIIITANHKKGIYWNWNEFDESVQEYKADPHWTPEGCERLVVALARDSGRDYVNDLNHALRKLRKPTPRKVEDMIRNVRHLDKQKILMLKGNRVGEYIIEHIEDEIRAKARCKEWDDLSYEKKNKYLIRETNRIRMNRVKDSEDMLYAKIRGRSVKHD